MIKIQIKYKPTNFKKRTIHSSPETMINYKTLNYIVISWRLQYSIKGVLLPTQMYNKKKMGRIALIKSIDRLSRLRPDKISTRAIKKKFYRNEPPEFRK